MIHKRTFSQQDELIIHGGSLLGRCYNVSPSRLQISRELTVIVEAWHIATTTDPLADSDEENPNQHVRHDYSVYTCRITVVHSIFNHIFPAQRLHILNRLRGHKPSPTPEGLTDTDPRQPAPASIEMSNSFPGRWQKVSWD
jgi:hypothetical protein